MGKHKRLPRLDCQQAYRDQARYYDLMLTADRYDEETSDIPFYLKEAKCAKGPVLEIACGTGRITLALAQKGVDITGLDVSRDMLKIAKEKATELNVKMDFVRADCRDFLLRKKFALIFIPFNSMLHLHDRVSLEAFWGCIKKHLLPGGRFIIDVFNPSMKRLVRQPGKRHLVSRFYDPVDRKWIKIEGDNCYDDINQINQVIWYYTIGKQKDAIIEKLNMRCYFPRELDALLHYNGFDIIKKYGDFTWTPFGAGAQKQIVICRAHSGK